MATGRAGLAVVAALVAAPAWAQQAPVFPPALEGEALGAWLKRETDIIPYQVVAVSPSAVTAVMSTFPVGDPPGARVVVRAEAASAEAFAREKVLSWHVSVSADCAGRRIRLGETTGYDRRNLIGGGRMIRPADSDWRPLKADTPLEAVWKAACEPGFRRPIAQPPMPAAAPPPPPPAIRAQAPAAPDVEIRGTAARMTARVAVARTAPSGGGTSVQISATASEAAAQADLKALGDRLGGRATRVERAEVGGKTYYRALVTGFAAGEAERFCGSLKAAGKACFVRR